MYAGLDRVYQRVDNVVHEPGKMALCFCAVVGPISAAYVWERAQVAETDVELCCT